MLPCRTDVIPSSQSALKFNLYESSGGKKGTQPVSRSGNAVKRRPTIPKYKDMRQQCHCFQHHCARKGSDVASTCPIKCIDPSTNARYPWTDGKCTCPTCSCNCNKKYNVGDICEIQVAIQTREMTESGLSSMDSNHLQACEGSKFFAQSMAAGAMVANQTCHTISAMNENGSAAIKPEDQLKYTNQVFARATAQHMVLAAGGIDMNTQFAIQMNARKVAKSSKVYAPNGTLVNLNNSSVARGLLKKSLTPMLGARTDLNSFRRSNNGLSAMQGAALAQAHSTLGFSSGSQFVSPPSVSTRNDDVIHLEHSDEEDDWNNMKMPARPPMFPLINDGPSPRKKAWDRAKKSNQRYLHIDKGENLTDEQKQDRKRAKKTMKHMMVNESKGKEIVTSLTSHNDNYGIEDGTFDSQGLVSAYQTCWMSDEDEQES